MLMDDIEISNGYSSHGGPETGTMSAVVKLKKGDVVKVRNYPYNGSNEIILADWSYFSGYRIQ